MGAKQLSLFSDDELDVTELNKKKKHTGPLKQPENSPAVPVNDVLPENTAESFAASVVDNPVSTDKATELPTAETKQEVEEIVEVNTGDEATITSEETITDFPEDENIYQETGEDAPEEEKQPAPYSGIPLYLPTPDNLRLADGTAGEGLSPEDLALKYIHQEMSNHEKLTDDARYKFLEQVKSVSLGCTKCRLAESRTQVVFSDGHIDAPILLVGEGPGENEDKQGIPFVGKAGQLLDKILESVGIIRARDIYIANVVKCRPPENRVPLEDEASACSVYLEKQLELSQSSIILLTGATALKAILNSTSTITMERGKWFEWKGKWVMPVFHPSYLLRNQSKEVGSPKWLMWQDIKKVKQKLDELKGNS